MARPRKGGPFLLEGEVLNESELASAVNTHLQSAELANDLPGGADVVRLLLARSRKLLRLGGIEVEEATSKDGSIVPMARKEPA